MSVANQQNRVVGDCAECGGSGVIDSGGVTPWGTGINVECPACHGTGQDNPPPGYYHGKCPTCGGRGRYEPPETRCPYCDRIANAGVERTQKAETGETP